MAPIRTHITGLQLLAVFGALGFTLSVLKFIPNYVDQEKWPLSAGPPYYLQRHSDNSEFFFVPSCHRRFLLFCRQATLVGARFISDCS